MERGDEPSPAKLLTMPAVRHAKCHIRRLLRQSSAHCNIHVPADERACPGGAAECQAVRARKKAGVPDHVSQV